MKRRTALKTFLTGAAGIAASPSLLAETLSATEPAGKLKGNINHSVCKWTYDFLSLEELCVLVKKTGFRAIDLCGPKDWPTLKKHGIWSSMCNGAEINLVDGWNHTAFHPTLIKNYTEHIELVAAAGYKNLICFSGNRRGMDDETGLKNMTDGIKKIIGLAEQKGVVIQIEVFNSKVDHKDYMADNTKWAIELCKRIGSDNFKILYDIYHMQIDEGDIIHTIRDNHQWFGHYHTAGVPGRHEIDETQELNYPAIMRAIAATGFKDYVAQEFIPTGDTTEKKVAALVKAIKICDI
ncbi:MAG: TIM barrel protein [Chitinophagaceae bacterium]|nr:TIM barrel protein [Chitinophagaceae bacterium]MBL0334640.1 TIM barrel protein [Chitinophagaceae bacterium]